MSLFFRIHSSPPLLSLPTHSLSPPILTAYLLMHANLLYKHDTSYVQIFILTYVHKSVEVMIILLCYCVWNVRDWTNIWMKLDLVEFPIKVTTDVFTSNTKSEFPYLLNGIDPLHIYPSNSPILFVHHSPTIVLYFPFSLLTALLSASFRFFLSIHRCVYRFKHMDCVSIEGRDLKAIVICAIWKSKRRISRSMNITSLAVNSIYCTHKKSLNLKWFLF